MTTMTTPQIDIAEQLLERMLTGDLFDRLVAHGEALNAGCGGLTVVDRACSDHHDRPLVLPMAALHAHLARIDSAAAITARGGERHHGAGSVRLGSLEDAAGYGPAYGAGGTAVGDDL